jgi:glycosyltransferase involved in cell wall biosynthesis
VLKVLFPFVGDSVGGSHHSTIELYRELRRNNIASSIVLHQKGPLSSFLDDIGIRYGYFPIQNLAGESSNIFLILYGVLINSRKIYKYVQRNEISIVHGNDLRINLTWSLPTRLSSASYVWHQRSLMSSSILWMTSAILADHFITISKYVHNSLPVNIPKLKKTLILNPFNTEKSYNKKISRVWLNDICNIPKDPILLGYVGRIVDWKNVDFLIKCFAEYVKSSDYNLYLIIVGHGDNRYVNSLKQLTYKLGVNNITTFTGFNSEPNRVISALDIMIAPSNKEPFGRTIVEAMVQKTPILAARGGGHSEIIDDNITGRIYDHNNIYHFISQCNAYINDNKSTNKIINKANDIISLKYSSHKHAESVIKVYKQLLTI